MKTLNKMQIIIMTQAMSRNGLTDEQIEAELKSITEKLNAPKKQLSESAKRLATMDFDNDDGMI